MRALLRSAMSLLLVAVIFGQTFAGTLPPPVSTPSTTPEPAPCAAENNGQARGKVQTLKGDAAKLRIQQLAGKNKALKRALKDFEKIGKTPVWESSAVFTQLPAE